MMGEFVGLVERLPERYFRTVIALLLGLVLWQVWGLHDSVVRLETITSFYHGHSPQAESK